jgi:endonuclease YncB( thermonuclease family)
MAVAKTWPALIAAASMGLALSTPAHADVVGVASVIDADTIEIHGERIRLFGIDAPESCQTCEERFRPDMALWPEGGPGVAGPDRASHRLLR